MHDIDIRLLSTPAAIVDESGVVRHANEAWADVVGSDGATTDTIARGLSGTAATTIEIVLADGRWAQIQAHPYGGEQAGSSLCTVSDSHDLRSRLERLQERSRMQERLLNVSIDCIKLIDPTGRLRYLNDAGCSALGVDPSSGFGQVWLDLLTEDTRPQGEQALAQARRGETARFSGFSRLPDGSIESWDNLLTPTVGDDGSVTSILCVSRNVSDERAARAALLESQERLAMATGVGRMGIWDFDLASRQLFCDDMWHEIMGLDPARPVTSLDDFVPLIHPDDRERATEVTQTAERIAATGEDYANTFRILRPDGEERWVRSSAGLVEGPFLGSRRAVGFMVDITDSLRGQLALEEAHLSLEQERDMLEQRSLEDPLTQLPNRRALAAELDSRVLHARRTGSPISVAMIDLDHFKLFNDHYGHLDGDAVLVAFADCLRQVIRGSDFAARFGGEEFVLVLVDTDDPEPVLQRLFDLLQAADMAHEASPHGRVTISCGCAVFAEETPADPRSVIEAADRALYEAKSAGRNRFALRRYPQT